MNVNILVPSLETMGYFRAQKPATFALADKLTSHHIQPLHPFQCRGRAISASMAEHFGTFHFPSLSLCSPFLVPSAHVPWLASPRCPVVPLRRADPHLAPALRHPTSRGAGGWHWEPTLGSSSSPKSRHVLVTLGEFCSTVRRPSMVVHVCLLLTFR